METPIELVRRFCAAWSDNLGAAELAAFFSADALSQYPAGAGHRSGGHRERDRLGQVVRAAGHGDLRSQ